MLTGCHGFGDVWNTFHQKPYGNINQFNLEWLTANFCMLANINLDSFGFTAILHQSMGSDWLNPSQTASGFSPLQLADGHTIFGSSWRAWAVPMQFSMKFWWICNGNLCFMMFCSLHLSMDYHWFIDWLIDWLSHWCSLLSMFSTTS